MKKKSKKNRHENKNRVSQEDRVLNTELGNFGLEPPKIYRNREKNNNLNTENDYDFGELNYFSKSRTSQNRNERTAYKDNKNKKNNSRNQSDRKVKKRKSHTLSKKTKKVLFYGTLTVLIIAVALVLSLTVLFKVHTITVKGNVVYSTKQVLTVLPVQNESNLFMINKNDAAGKLEENLPYIYSVDIKRKLPSTLVVNIKETPQVYYIKNSDSSYTYLDDKLKILETHGLSVPQGAIEIRNANLKSSLAGQEAEFTDKKIKKNLSTLIETVKDLKLDSITAVYSEDINNNYLVYDNRITIKLGTLNKLERKIYSSLAAAQKLDESNQNTKGTITATDDKQVYFTAE